MIFRHFTDPHHGGHSYLIASRASREAAIVNPHTEHMESYGTTLAELGLRLVLTLRTDRNGKCADAARHLAAVTGAQACAPAHSANPVDNADVAVPGASIALGDLQVEVIRPPRGYSGDVGYRVSYYTFAGSSVLIDFHEEPAPRGGEPEAILEATRAMALPCSGAHAREQQPIRSFRESREGVCVERLILEDLHTSLSEDRFTPKEQRIIRTYIQYMEEHDFAHPSAAELAELLASVDRTAVHVLVHNIRWKQIDLDRLPVVLARPDLEVAEGAADEARVHAPRAGVPGRVPAPGPRAVRAAVGPGDRR